MGDMHNPATKLIGNPTLNGDPNTLRGFADAIQERDERERERKAMLVRLAFAREHERG